ncbi:DUF2905 domain-containing protein [Salibacterium halotolerans]|uniref:DUF2905 domain-containing protein n=1 Tax=Salibacterium halotolerans TaxID=1884432 RepID=A0A1I5UFA9_9BACI|nr:DUF2905 domain-containing protein [Salibacterium halotolerans]SFP93899.1 Protein of unknown function [Salibacterium halotolerans]
MNDIPKLLIGLGIVLVLTGLIWQVGGKYIPLGRLPGDIIIKNENTSFYFPIVTCIVVSIILSLVFYIIGRFR